MSFLLGLRVLGGADRCSGGIAIDVIALLAFLLSAFDMPDREVLNHFSDQNFIDRERCDVILVFDKLIGDRLDAVSSTTLRYIYFSGDLICRLCLQ